MVSPIIICDGVIRSGSTWSYNVCRILGQLVAARRSQRCGMACLGHQSLDRFLQNDVLLAKGPVVIKSHEIGPIALQWIGDGRAKAVCTFRDPRDCVASDIPFWGQGFEASVQRVVASLKALAASYHAEGQTLFVRYEEMMQDRRSQIRRIAEYLQIPISDTEVASIDDQTNIDATQKICQGIAQQPTSKTDPVLGNHRRDRLTLLHDNHIGSAKAGRWRDDLTVEQAVFLTKLFEPSLRVMGYEIDGAAPSNQNTRSV
jgi:hypothetical protein